MSLRQQLQVKRTLRLLRTWAPPISIGVIVGVGLFTFVDSLDRPPQTAQPFVAQQSAVHVAQPDLPDYALRNANPAPRVQQPEPPPFLRRASSNSSFGNCAEARAAGRSSIRYGEDGYSPHLDGDDDGVACEPYYGR